MKITKENYVNIYPNSLNMLLMEEKRLSDQGKLNDKYFILLNNYKYLLCRYLIGNTSLKHFDDELKQSNLMFSFLDLGDMDFYQSTSYLGLTYLYLRNNLYVEKLSEEDIEKIVNLDYNNLQLLDECSKIVSRTFKNVINVSDSNEDDVKVCYGLDANKFWFNSDELVIGFRYDEYKNDNLSDKEWEENYFLQIDYLKNFFINFEDTLSKELGMKVKIVQYTEFTVMDNYSYYR